MTTGKALNEKPYAGNPHVRFDEGEVASVCTAEALLRREPCRRQPEGRASGCATPRRGSLLYKTLTGMKKLTWGKVILFALFAAVTGEVRAATTIYVDSTRPDDSGSGDGWGTAKKTIQAAIDIAAQNDTVLIAKGTYQISSALTISGTDQHIELRGATGDPADVVVDAQGLCPCLVSLNKQQIVVSSITFENGSSTEDGDVAGGITATDKSMVTNCIVRSCHHVVSGKDVKGGGIKLTTDKNDTDSSAGNWPNSRRYLPQIVDTVVENCAICTDGSSNKIYAQGGGVYAMYHNTSRLTVRNCSVTNLSATLSSGYTNGGGAYLFSGTHENDAFISCSIENPDGASGYLSAGAGAYLISAVGRVRCRLSDSCIAWNRSRGCGAGLGMGACATVDGCSIVSNSLSHVTATTQYQVGGAGIYVIGDNCQIANTLVADNISTNDGNAVTYAGAVSAESVTNLVVHNCVVRDNVLQDTGAFSFISVGDLMVSNCVMAGNVATGQISAIRFFTNQTDPKKCGMALITDCYIVSNSNSRTAALSSCGGILQYSGVHVNSADRYGAPLTVRNCLFAGNSAKNCSYGWGVRAKVNPVGKLLDDVLLAFDHCTFARNLNGSNYPNFIGYAGSEEQANAAASHTKFTGCVFWENRYSNNGMKLAYVSALNLGTEFMHCYSDVTNAAFVVTADNGNISEGNVRFADPGNLDFRLEHGGCLVDKGGAFEPWMGTGRKNSVQDMGAGYVIGKVGKYGVTVGRRQTNPRRYGIASDIGCCEYWVDPGFVMVVK